MQKNTFSQSPRRLPAAGTAPAACEPVRAAGLHIRGISGNRSDIAARDQVLPTLQPQGRMGLRTPPAAARQRLGTVKKTRTRILRQHGIAWLQNPVAPLANFFSPTFLLLLCSIWCAFQPDSSAMSDHPSPFATRLGLAGVSRPFQRSAKAVFSPTG